MEEKSLSSAFSLKVLNLFMGVPLRAWGPGTRLSESLDGPLCSPLKRFLLLSCSVMSDSLRPHGL